MYRTPRNAGVLLALGLVSVSQFTWAGYKFEDGDLSGEFSFSAGGSTVTARNINFGAGVKDLRSGKDRGTKTTWQEIYVKPKVAFDYKLNPDLSLLAGGSVVAASTFGDGDAGGNTRSSDGSASVEEAYAGFRAGNWKFTAGRQDYMIGTGFIVMDGNLDTFGDGAYWLGPRTAFRDSALLAWDGGAAQVQAFSLATDDHLGDFRMNGVNLDYDVGGAVVLGATAMKVDALEGHTPARAARDGMQVYNVRALKAVHPALPALELNGEYAVQRGNGDGVDYDANAWYAEADYTFDMLPFAPVLGYRYTHFSGDSDLRMLRSTCRAAAASCNFPGTYSVIGRKVTEKSCTESFFDRFSVLNANLTHTHELFSNPPQVCQGEQRGQLSRVFHQPTKTYFHVTKLPLDHAKRMLDLGPCLSLAELDLALGFVQYAALVQLGIGAATRCNLPDHPPIFMLFAPFDTGVTGICIHGVFFAMQQFSHLRDIGHIGSGAMDVMHQAGLDIGTDVRLHPEEILTAFLGLVHLGITLAFFIFGRAGGMNNGGIDDGALAQRQAFFLQITIDDRKDCRCELMLLQQVPEVHDRGVFGDWRAQRQACELAHGRDFVERFFHGRVAQGEPVLQQMDAQHGFQRIGFSTAAGLGVERFDQLQQACPGHHLIHFGEEALSAGLLALAGVLKVGKAHLAHGRLGSGVAGILA